MRKVFVGLLAAAALVASGPVVAQSRAAPADVPTRSGADMEDSNEVRGGYILPAAAIVAVILVILALTDTWPFDDDPVSP